MTAFVALALILVSGTASAQVSRLELLGPDLVPVRSVQLTVEPGSTAAEQVVYLRQRKGNDAQLDDIQLVINLSKGSGQLFLEGTTTSAAEPFDLPGNESIQAIRISVKLPAGERASGSVVAKFGRSAEKLADLAVEALEAPALQILESGATGIERAATVTDYTLFLTVLAGSAGARGVDVLVPALTGPDKVQVPVTVNLEGGGGAIDLDPDQMARLSISAQLATPGEYSGGLVLVHDGKQEPRMQIKITRTQVAPTVEILGITRLRFTEGETVFLDVLIRETAGHRVTLDRPILIPLGLKEGDSRTGPSFKSDEVIVERVDSSGSFEPVGSTVELGPGETATLRFTIPTLGGPGEYGALLMLTSPASSAVTGEATFLVRRSATLALGLIIGGVALTFVVREGLQKRSERARRRIQLAQLLEETDRLRKRFPGLSALEVETIDSLDQELANLDQTDDAGAFPTAIEVLQLKTTLLTGWLLARRRVAALKRPPSDPDPYASRLERVREAILFPRAVKGELDTHTKTLEEVNKELDAAVRTQLVSEITTLRDEVKRVSGELSSDDEYRKRLETDVLAKLEAELANISKDATSDQILSAIRQLNMVIGQYATILLERLLEIMAGPPPPSVGGDDWTSLRTQIEMINATAGADPAERLAAYRKAYAIYLTRRTEWLRAAITSKREELLHIVGDNSPTDEQKQVLARYGAAEAEATSISALVAGQDLLGADTAFKKAEAELQAAELSAGGPEAQSPPPAFAVPERPPSTGLLSGVMPRRVPSVPYERRVMRYAAWIVAGISLLFAAVLGFSALYSGNETWGSPLDLAVAFLWGGGFYEVAGQTLHGYAAVRTKLLTP